ncbi:YitT family protein [Mariniplasma anaerobium]|uniref:Membrane protein n=1 Tax=Mariniplasma anaerobium TaxID=2735436 RepID=A0A7U9TLC4_9MOLU|nr:YitT family protein [Mariniplasma anaerobium]BCR35378.1 membrane protein [Mariniplasma anaerobium]
MNKLITFLKSETYINKIYPEVKRVGVVILFTFIYGIGVAWFLEASVVPLYSGGIPGLGQLVRDTLFVIFNVDVGANFLGLFVIIANIPILLLGWFGVSHRFTIYSMISILIQAFILSWMPQIDMGLGSVEHAFTSAVLGGLLIGIGAGGALRYGTSTGGLDIIAQYLSFKKGKSVGTLSMAMNLFIAILGGFIVGGKIGPGGEVITGGVIISYTVIRVIVSTILTDRMHTAYQFLSVDIITQDPQALVDEILHKVYRGVTLMKVEGAYSHHEKTLIYVVISSYELHALIALVKKTDPHAFMVTRPTKHVFGNFARKTIA